MWIPLKISHKLSLLLLTTILVVLLLVGTMFRILVTDLHEAEARLRIGNAFERVRADLAERREVVRQGAERLAARGDVGAVASMIDRYQDVDQYQPLVFDVEKQKLATALANEAQAAGIRSLALHDTRMGLSAFAFLVDDRRWATGYLSYREGVPMVMVDADGADGPLPYRKAEELPDHLGPLPPLPEDSGALLLRPSPEGVDLEALAPIRVSVPGGERWVGTVRACGLLDASWVVSLAQQTRVAISLLLDDGTTIPGPERWVAPPSPPGQLPLLDHLQASPWWFPEEGRFLGAARQPLSAGGEAKILIHLEKAQLIAHLHTFQQAALWVMLMAGALTIPLGLWLGRRTITRPVDRLVAGVEALQRNRYRPLEGFSSRDELGMLAKAFNVMVTTLAQREAELRKLHRAVEQSPAMVMITDLQGNLEYVNPKFLEVTGYAAAEVLGRNPRFLKSERTPPEVYRQLWATITAGGEWRGELLNRKKNGELIWESAIISPIKAPDGSLLHFLALKEDITERKRAEEARRESEEKVRSLLMSTGEAVYGIDLEGNCTFCNTACLTVLGYSAPDQLLNRNMHRLIHHHHPDGSPYPEEACRIVRAYREGRGIHVENEVMFRADGTGFPVEYRSQPIHREGRVVGAVVTFTDITQRQRAEQSLLRAKQAADAANRAKSAFLAVMSHEMRTPLNAILGMAEVVQESDLDPDQRRCLEVLSRSGSLLLSLIGDILDLTSIEAGQLPLESQPVDLEELVRDAVAIHALNAERKGVALVSQVADDLPRTIVGDPKRLRQILLNLLGNGVKFTDRGRVEVRVEWQDRDNLLFSVTDTGIGIPEEKRKLIFDSFAQADSSTTRSHGGSGLGLTLCRKLVESMGGEIRVESEVGAGSRFRFTLPQPREAPPVPLQPANGTGIGADSPPPARQLTVLLAEDAEDNRLLIQTFLRGQPIRLETAANGEEAVQRFCNGRFDLVLMDIQMPLLDGLDATRQIREWERETGRRPTPILALTAHALEEDRERSLAAGCDSHLTKPIRKKALLAAIARHASGPGD